MEQQVCKYETYMILFFHTFAHGILPVVISFFHILNFQGEKLFSGKDRQIHTPKNTTGY
jgi:hypothetical protein